MRTRRIMCMSITKENQKIIRNKMRRCSRLGIRESRVRCFHCLIPHSVFARSPLSPPKLRYFARSGPPFVIRSVLIGWGCLGLQMVERENGLSGRERGDRANIEYKTPFWVFKRKFPLNRYRYHTLELIRRIIYHRTFYVPSSIQEQRLKNKNW